MPTNILKIHWIYSAKFHFHFKYTQPNAAGRAFQKLFNETWRTNVIRKLTNSIPVHVRGFKGEYTINVKQNGHIIKSEQFTLGSKGVSLELHLPQTGTSVTIDCAVSVCLCCVEFFFSFFFPDLKGRVVNACSNVTVTIILQTVLIIWKSPWGAKIK